MAVRIRMKKMGRRHRPFFRIVVAEKRNPRDGKVLEEIGTYDPMITPTDNRVRLNSERVKYWLGVGAQPSEKVAILLKKYLDKVPSTKEAPQTPKEKPAVDETPAPPQESTEATESAESTETTESTGESE